MNDDLRAIAISITCALTLSAAVIWRTGCDGQFAGVKIGPTACWFKVAGQ